MISHLRQSTRALAGRLDDDERGAILLAALAACMVLIMVGMIIWDAGRSARDKIDVQNAADTAAYSQAAVRARSMNKLAFTNVAKRSIVGMHSMYYGMFSSLAIWYAEQCGEGSSVWSGDARYDCQRNRRLLSLEGGRGGAWERLVGDTFRPMQSPAATRALIARQMSDAVKQANRNNLATELFGNELTALDDYQRYLVGVTPWWAWTEGIVRATRNGADLAMTFPLPGPIESPDVSPWIEKSVDDHSDYNFETNDHAANTYDFDVSCPGTLSGDIVPSALLRRRRYGLSFTPEGLRFEAGAESCLPIQQPTGHATSSTLQERSDEQRSPLSDPAAREVGANLDLHRRRSEGDAHDLGPVTTGLDIAVSDAPVRDTEYPMGGGCFWSMRLGQHDTPPGASDNACGVRRFPAIPYSLNADGNSAADLMARSNLIFTYKYTPGRAMETAETDGRVTTRHQGGAQRTGGRNLLDSIGYGVEHEDSVTYGTQGYWSIARAEITYPHAHSNYRDPRQETAGGLHGLWLWRPGWTAKLRPLALPGEWDSLSSLEGYDLNGIYSATDPYLTLTGQLGIMDNKSSFDDRTDVARDLAFMEKATRTMDPDVMGGSIK